MKMKFKETNNRSVVKSVTFRILVVVADLIIIYAITKKADVTVVVIVATNIASTILYFLHERIWNDVSWGKQKTR